MAVFTIDTSAVSCYLRDEPGADLVEGLFDSVRPEGHVILMPFIVPMEVEYTSLRLSPKETVDRWLEELEGWPVQVVESNGRWGRMAAYVKSGFTLSLADAWVAALALLNDAVLLHKDPEFDAVPGLKHMRLPYTPRTRR